MSDFRLVYTDSCLTFELLLFLTSNVILFKCNLSLFGGLLTENGVFYCSETRFYTSSNLYFIKQDHQIRQLTFEKNDIRCQKSNSSNVKQLSV
jgi:hypothetical protein